MFNQNYNRCSTFSSTLFAYSTKTANFSAEISTLQGNTEEQVNWYNKIGIRSAKTGKIVWFHYLKSNYNSEGELEYLQYYCQNVNYNRLTVTIFND